MPIDIFDDLHLSLDDKIVVSDSFKKLVRKEIQAELDSIKIDLFDEVELTDEDKIILSDNFKNFLRETVHKEISKIPINEIFLKMKGDVQNKVSHIEDRAKAMNSEADLLKKGFKSFTDKINESIKKISETIKNLKDKYDDLKSHLITIEKSPRYEFGGYSPQFNDLNIGDPSANGSWRIVQDGNNLSVQKLESGTWVEKGAFTP